LLAARADGLPPEVREHVKHCPRCQTCQRRLARVDEHARQLPLPLASPGAREELLRRIDLEPREAPAQPAEARGALAPPNQVLPLRRRWRWLAAAAAAILVGVGLGWALWPGPARRGPLVAEGERRPAAGASVDERVVARALLCDLQLAQVTAPEEQLKALRGLAGELRGEAVRLSRDGPLEHLPLVAGLYERVVRQGLVGRARVLPAKQRERAFPALVQQLEEDGAELTQASEKALPVVAGHLRTMNRTAQAVAGPLRSGRVPEPGPMPPRGAEELESRGSPATLLAVSVRQGLALAEAKTPAQRAEHCSELAHYLAQDIVFVSASGDSDRAERLGEQLGEVLESGVANNLDLARWAPQANHEELERIRRRAESATATIEANMAGAKAPTQAALQRALEASRHGWKRHRELDKGPGAGMPGQGEKH
jgi:hypothetical protein